MNLKLRATRNEFSKKMKIKSEIRVFHLLVTTVAFSSIHAIIITSHSYSKLVGSELSSQFENGLVAILNSTKLKKCLKHCSSLSQTCNIVQHIHETNTCNLYLVYDALDRTNLTVISPSSTVWIKNERLSINYFQLENYSYDRNTLHGASCRRLCGLNARFYGN